MDAKLREACRFYCDSGDEAKKDVKYCAHVNTSAYHFQIIQNEYGVMERTSDVRRYKESFKT